MKALKWASVTLTAFVTIACIAAVFLGIWSTGDYWPMRFGSSAFVLLVLALPLYAATTVLWDE